MEQVRRLELRLALAAYLAGLVLLTLELGSSDRLPLPWWLVVVTFLSLHVGAGLLLRQWRWLGLFILLVPVAVVVGLMLENPLVLIFGGVFLAPPALVPLALGVGVGKALERRDRWTRFSVRQRASAVAGAMVALAVLPMLVALINKARTVRVERPHPVAIDERRGAVLGVGLGDRASRVRAVFGAAPRWGGDQSTGPLDEDGGALGSPSAGPSRRDTFLRYPKHSFWINGDRVWSVDIIDRGAQTRRGLGVGDSLSLVEDAYPTLRCEEGDAGSDEPDPFPYCSGRTGPGTYIYFGADYTKPGTPVTAITLARRPMS